MPWYKSGTVSVVLNSNAVIGAGTAFIANSRVGDAFLGPDGGWYEVTNIASDTAMSISPNYRGATNAVGTYALAPMQGYVKDSADTLRALVNTYGAKLAALGTTGNYDVLPPIKGGTGISDLSVFIQTLLNDSDQAAGRGTLGAARSGPNNDITSLSALTTALSVAQGGTGNTTGTAAKLAPSAIVGPVSQASGVPTGAIFETGSNANGRYTKFGDGTLICSVTLGVSFLNSANLGTTWTFPVVPTAITFLAANLTGVLGTTKAVTTVAAYARSGTGASLSAFSLGQFTPGDTSGVGMDGFLIGRWF